MAGKEIDDLYQFQVSPQISLSQEESLRLTSIRRQHRGYRRGRKLFQCVVCQVSPEVDTSCISNSIIINCKYVFNEMLTLINCNVNFFQCAPKFLSVCLFFSFIERHTKTPNITPWGGPSWLHQWVDAAWKGTDDQFNGIKANFTTKLYPAMVIVIMDVLAGHIDEPLVFWVMGSKRSLWDKARGSCSKVKECIY